MKIKTKLAQTLKPKCIYMAKVRAFASDWNYAGAYSLSTDKDNLVRYMIGK